MVFYDSVTDLTNNKFFIIIWNVGVHVV